MEINLAAKTISTPKTYLHSDGTLYTSYIEATGGKFKGSIEATSGSFTGEVKATTGIIGGFTIGSNALYKDLASLSSSGAGVYIGTDGLNLGGNFTADSSGSVYCNDINIRGGYIKIGQNFEVLADGTVRAVNGEFAGDIDATNIKALEKYNIYIQNAGIEVPIIYADNWTTDEGMHEERTVHFGIFPGSFYNDSYIKCKQEVDSLGGGDTEIHTSLDIDVNKMLSLQCYFNKIEISRNALAVTADTITMSGSVGVTSNLNVSGTIRESGSSLSSKYAERTHSHSTLQNQSTSVVGVYYDGNYALRKSDQVSSSRVYCGTTGAPWRNVTSQIGTFTESINAPNLTQTSDMYDKTDITDIPDSFEQLFMSLKPRSYLFNPETIDDDCPHRHIGFVAQEVEQALKENNVPRESFGGLYKTQQEEPLSDGRTQRYGLGYSEFTALNTYMLQKLYNTVEQQSKKIQELERRLSVVSL